MTAVARMRAALGDLADENRETPCRVLAHGDRDWWLSEDPAEREAAASHCLRCPIIDACRDYGAAIRPPVRFGVYGGHDYTPTAKGAAA